MALDLLDGFNASAAEELPENLPLFSIERVQLQFSVAADFVAAQVNNDVLVLALSNGRILRIDLNRPEDVDGQPLSYHEPHEQRAQPAGRSMNFSN